MPAWKDIVGYGGGSLVVAAIVHAILWRVLRPLFGRRRGARAIALLLVGLYPLAMAGLLWMNVLPRAVATPTMGVAFTWVGVSYFLLLCAPIALWPSWIPERWVRRWQRQHSAIDRQRLRRICCGVALAVAGALALHSVYMARRRPDVVHVRVPLSRWPSSLDGYRVAHLSDLHVGATIGRAQVQGVVDAVNAQDVDIVLITGDLVDGSVDQLAPHIAPLSALRSRHGVYAALGNHEYFSPTDAWIRHLATLGVGVLRNAWMPIGPFDLVGIDEWSAPEFTPLHAPDVDAALRGRQPHRPAIVMVHQPQALRALAALNRAAQGSGQPPVVDLQLSGHTHGGQLWPLGHLARWDQGVLQGLWLRDGLMVHVTPGTGYWGPPMRFLAAAQISILSLYRASDASPPVVGGAGVRPTQ